MQGRRKSRVIVAAGLATLVLAAGCTGLGVEVPSGPASESSAPAVTEPPSESESAPMSESPTPSETPSSETPTSSGEPPVPIKEGFDLSDPGWRGVTPPVVMQGLEALGAKGEPPMTLTGGYKLTYYQQPRSGVIEGQYKREGDIGYLVIRLDDSKTFPPPAWGTVVSTMTNPRPVGVSLCFEWLVAGSAGCMALTEDIKFEARYEGVPQEMTVEQQEPLLEEFIRHFAKK